LAFGEETLKRVLKAKLFEALRGAEFIAIEPHVRGADLKSYAESIGGGDWGQAYALFIYKGSLMALHGRLPSGLYDVMEGRWVWVEGRSYYEPIGGVAVDNDTETVAWTSWGTPYVFIYDGSTVKMVSLGEATEGNIVRGPDGNFYAYGNAGNLYRITPRGDVARVSTNPDAKGGTCWFGEMLGNTLFFAGVYPDNSIYAYDVDRASWSTPKPGTTDPHTPGYYGVFPATWDTLATLAAMQWPLPQEQLLGFITFMGPTLLVEDYGILPYVVESADVWNISIQPLPLEESQTVYYIHGITWLIGHPSYAWGRFPGLRPLGGFFRFASGISWKGDLYLGTSPLLMGFRGGLLNSDIQRFGGVVRLKRSELYKLQLPPAKAVLWRGKSVSAGEYSLPLVTMGWREVTLYFKSNTPGDLTVEVDPVGDGEWDTYIVRTSTTKEFLTIDEHFARIRLKFSTTATVTASAMLVP
jgi:hypothetical protein